MRLILGTILGLVLAPAAVFADSSRTTVAEATRSALRRSGLESSSIAYCIVDAASAASLAEHRAHEPMIPASNAKILTTGAALEALGAGFEFRTYAALDESTTPPRLWIVGSGDPAFGDDELARATPELSVEGILRQWAAALRAKGVGRIGELVVDDRIFDRSPHPAGWPLEQYGNGYCAETWGLNANRNMIDLVAVGRGGSVALELAPDYGLRVVRNTASVRPKSKFSIAVARPIDSNDLTVRGTLDRDRSSPLGLTVHDTPSLVAALAARILESAGVEVASHRLARPDDPAPVGRVLEPVHATPIATVLERANTDSENLYAEALLKRLGAAASNASGAAPGGEGWIAGSWANGCDALRSGLTRRLGEESIRAWRTVDGSGLARDNRVDAHGTCRWLASFAREPGLAPSYFGSFAIAGRTGTVRRRFQTLEDSPVEVRCKTGYIRGVSCLSGLAIGPGGRAIAFSVLGNGLEAGDRVSRAKALQEAIVLRVVEELTPPPATAPKGR
jgi:D-alanyl-D-alanine carboxypeptidase/D-alanyl-D-alanine-endopeptidase (penicillin-binding protein 4)